MLVVTLTLFLLSYLLMTFCTQSKILYTFMPDLSSGENLSFIFYEASLDSPLELEQIGEASPDKMPGRDMFFTKRRW